MQKENSKSMKEQIDATTASLSNNLQSVNPKYYCLDSDGHLQTLPADDLNVKINQAILVFDGIKTYYSKVISFDKKTRLINIKINKKPAMCFKHWQGKYYLLHKNPNK